MKSLIYKNNIEVGEYEMTSIGIINVLLNNERFSLLLKEEGRYEEIKDGIVRKIWIMGKDRDIGIYDLNMNKIGEMSETEDHNLKIIIDGEEYIWKL